MKILLLIGLLLTGFSGTGQKNRPERVGGSFSMVVESYMSQDQAKSTALEQARLQAMADAFGTKVSQSTRTRIETSNGMTDTRFNTIANSFVNGIWVEDLKEPEFSFSERGGDQWITCNIVGNARRVVKAAPEFQAKPLKCLNLGCATQEFKDGDPMFFYFRSPVDGYLSLYIDDEKYCQMMLPYQNMKGNTLKIEADKEYFLFRQDPKYNYTDLSVVDEYQLFTNNQVQEMDLIYVIFSTQDYFKPSLDTDKSRYAEDSGADTRKFTDFPKATDSKSFRNWLNKNVSVNENMFLEVIDITISK